MGYVDYTHPDGRTDRIPDYEIDKYLDMDGGSKKKTWNPNDPTGVESYENGAKVNYLY